MPHHKNGIKRTAAAAPKKGQQIRAKSGCYTCRIRRKKCDEEKHPDQRCGACVRLNIQCLGFGSKRPDWLKDRTPEITRRIKEHLAGNGKIKNQAASSSRSSLDAPSPYLQLVDDHEDDALHYDSSESPRDYLTITSDESITPSPFDANPLALLPSLTEEPSFPDYTNLPYPASTSTIEPSLVVSFPARTFTQMYAPFEGLPEDFEDFSDEIPEVFSIHPSLLTGSFSDGLVNHYIKEVAAKQWLLVEQHVLPKILHDALNGGIAQDGARLLALIHFNRQQNGDISQDVSVQQQYTALKVSISGNGMYSADAAWGALFAISSFLFSGGRGEWDFWLHIACTYARMLIKRYPSAQNCLARCTPRERHSIKAAIWFDVLASVTTCKEPLLLDIVRELFHPSASGMQDLSLPPDGEPTSMLPLMGCESRILWALAETAALSTWKARQTAAGKLSMPQLVSKSQEIERCLQIPISSFHHGNSETDLKRHYCSEMFRLSTTLFLRSVVSGDHPKVQEISEAVDDVFSLLSDLEVRLPRGKSAVIRMTVFSLFICGSLADSEDLQNTLVRRYLNNEGAVGNCSTLPRLLKRVWDSRMAQPASRPVAWREILQNEKMLLV